MKTLLDFVTIKKIPNRKKLKITDDSLPTSVVMEPKKNIQRNVIEEVNVPEPKVDKIKKLESVDLHYDSFADRTIPLSINNSNKRPYDDDNDYILQPPVLVESSPVVFQQPKQPAYKRYSSLLNKSKTSLELPCSLKNLIKIFVALESVLNYLKSRDTVAIFHKIQRSVQNQAGVNFELKHLAQIVHIYPEAYKLCSVHVLIQEKRTPSLSIEYFDDKLKTEFVKNLEQKSKPLVTGAKLSSIIDVSNDTSMMSMVSDFVKQIPLRRQTFETKLELYVKQFHDKFLQEKGLGHVFSKIDPCWHYEFDLESIEPIPLAELPIKKETISYVDELQRKHKSTLLKQTKPEIVDQEKAETRKEEPQVAKVDANGKPLSRSKLLLERIREKERLRKEQEALNPKESPENQKKRSMLKKMVPISSSLHNLAKTKGKSVLPVPVAVSHLQQNFVEYYLTNGTFEIILDQWFEHLKFLAELVPQFCTIEVLVISKNISPLKAEHYLLRFHQGRMKSVNETITPLL